MNKNIISLATVMLTAGYALSAQAETSLSLSETTIVPGSVGTVTVSLNNDIPCRGLTSHIELPEGLSILGITPTGTAAGCMANVNTTPGSEQFYLLPAATALQPEAGAVCELTFAASNTFKGGSITLTDASIVDESFIDRQLSDCRGYVSGMGTFSVSVPDFMIMAGESKQIEIRLDNIGYAAGVQADLYLPQGLTLEPSSVSITSRTAGMTAMCAFNDNSYYRLMVFSTMGASISGTDGAVMTATVTADADLRQPLEVPLEIKVCNVSVSDPKGKNYKGADSTATVTVTSGQSDIAFDLPGMGIEDGVLWMKVGQSKKPAVTTSNYDGALLWTSSNESVATVSSTGEVTAKGAGDAVITVTTADGRDISAWLPVTAYLPGDSNADKWVDVADVVNVNNYVVGNDVETFVFIAADINEDKDIDVTDAVKTAYIALEADLPPAKLMRRAMAYSSVISGDYAEVSVKGNIIGMALPNSVYSALQADITLPTGLTVTDAVLGEGATPSHRIITRMKDANTLRVMVFALDNAEFAVGDLDIVELRLSGTPDATSPIEVSNVIAADTEARSHILEAKINRGTVTGVEGVNADGIRISATPSGVEITGAQGDEARVYTLDGKEIVAVMVSSDCETISLEKGIYIVAVKDAVKKVSVK